MAIDRVILSSEHADPEFAELSRSDLKYSGKLFRKQIFRWGEFGHPAKPDFKIKVDRTFYDTLKRNFENRVCPIVQVPLVDDQNRHTEAPDRNTGEVIDLGADDDGIYAVIDVRRHAEEVGNTILGASAKLALNYIDRRTETQVGPTLLHVAMTNRPFLTNLSAYESISLSDNDTTNDENVVLLTDSVPTDTTNRSKENSAMDKTEAIAALSEYGIDVEAGQQALATLNGYIALSDVLGEGVEANPDTISTTIVDLTNSLKERDDKLEVLEEELRVIKLSAAEEKVDTLIEQGRIRPVTKDKMIELQLSDPETFELFLLPAEEAEVEMSEQGVTTTESTHQEDPGEVAKAMGQRLAGRAN